MPMTRKRQQQLRQEQELQEEQPQQGQDESSSPMIIVREEIDGDSIDQHSSQPDRRKRRANQKQSKIKQETSNELAECDEKTKLASIHKNVQEILETDLNCAICREVYVNPLILNCSHSFCKYCLYSWLSKHPGCPSCRMAAVFQTENLALRSLIQKMMQTSSAKFNKERDSLVRSREEAEKKQQEDGIRPMMEVAASNRADQSETNEDNQEEQIRRRIIGEWKGPNGATIWRTKIIGANEVALPDAADFSDVESEVDNSPWGNNYYDDGDDDDDDEDYSGNDDDIDDDSPMRDDDEEDTIDEFEDDDDDDDVAVEEDEGSNSRGNSSDNPSHSGLLDFYCSNNDDSDDTDFNVAEVDNSDGIMYNSSNNTPSSSHSSSSPDRSDIVDRNIYCNLRWRDDESDDCGYWRNLIGRERNLSSPDTS